MIDFYEKSNVDTNVLMFVTKAYQLNPNNYYKQSIKELDK